MAEPACKTHAFARGCRIESLGHASYCIFVQVLVKIYLGYEAGVAKPAAMGGPPIYGQLVSERVKGLQVLELWAYDFPLNTRAATDLKPLHVLWKPQLSVFLETQFGLTGMERVPAGSRWRWVAQRWLCEPKSLRDILDELRAVQAMKPGEIRGDTRRGAAECG